MKALPADAEGILSIAQVAALAGVQKRRMHRLLLSLHGRDKDIDAPSEWLVRVGHKWLVSMQGLRKAHGALFAIRYVTPEQVDELEERLAELEAKQSETRLRVNAVASRVRAVAGKVA